MENAPVFVNGDKAYALQFRMETRISIKRLWYSALSSIQTPFFMEDLAYCLIKAIIPFIAAVKT